MAATLCVAVAALLLAGACGGTGPSDDDFGNSRNWSGKYLRVRLLPEQQPVLGEYSSRSSLVIQQHVSWAEAAQIDFFAIPWRGRDSWEDVTISDYLLANSRFADIDWCIIYEMPTILMGNPEATVINLTLAARDTLLAHMRYFHDNFFAAPNYLRLNGDPVVFLHKSRLIAADAFNALAALRLDYSDATGGEGLFLVGDEAVWGSIGSPNGSRISAMDAITGIDLALVGTHSGYTDVTGFFDDLTLMWQEYETAGLAADPVVPLFPMVWPGYNDRASSAVQHPVIARERTSVLTQQGGTYMRMWSVANARVGSPAVVLLNSFNDWQRDTQIEPVADNGDDNGSTVLTTYTGGMRYFPYQTHFVDATASQKGPLLLGAIYEVWYHYAP